MDLVLKDQDIINIIKDYIENKNTDYAVMIDGEWGSGKTYFVLKKLKPQLEKFFEKKKPIKFIYVSAYGVKDTKELDNKIYEEIIREFLPDILKNKYKDIGNGVEAIYKIVKEVKKWPDISKNSIKPIIEILQKRNEKNYILVFDDLERSEMPISELMGYINEFVEHKEMKTIIVANEKEILKKKMYSNSEMKYIAAESEILNIPVEKKGFIDILNDRKEDKSTENKKIDINELNERVEKIFGEDLLYSQIKEKLIGITIYYVPNLEEVNKTIFEEYIENRVIREYIERNNHRIINLMQNKNHLNIRTLKISLKILEKIFLIMLEIDTSKYDEKAINSCKMDILIYTITACIEYKEGTNKEHSGSEIFIINQESRVSDAKNGFRFIDDIIDKSYVHEERIKNVIEEYLKIKAEDANDSNDPINILMYYWQMDDEEIKKNYEDLKKKLQNNLYKSTLYSKIMYLVIKLVNIGFPKKYIEEIKSIMIKNLEDLKNSNRIEEFNAFDELDFSFDNDEEKRKYEEIIQPIKQIISDSKNKNKINNINSTITKKEKWGEEFSSYCMDNKGQFILQKEFFNLLNIDNLFDVIKQSKTKDVSDFRRSIATIYHFRNINEFYKNDIYKLRELLEKLEGITSEELNQYCNTKKYNINLLKENIKQVIELLEK